MYRIFIFLYLCAIRLAALWNPKARLWVLGRKDWIAETSRHFKDEQRTVVWFHCASLGEFEQGRPLIEQLRQRYPGIYILLTFYSPSGYEACKDYQGADHISYLPIDTPANARRFIDICAPSLVVFVKYEFWHHYLEALKTRQIPTLLVSAVFRDNQPFFRWYGRFWRNMLGAFSQFFVQDNRSLDLLEGLGLGGKSIFSGDTRFDRVLEITEDRAGRAIPPAAAFADGGPLIVAGSTWSEDEKELAHFVRTHPGVRFILAPHEISKEHLREIRQRFPDHVLYSEYSRTYAEKTTRVSETATQATETANQTTETINLATKTTTPPQCLIIDNIGMLSRLYQYATITYVGGGFGGDGVHNVLEAAVWGKPVVFGPIYDKYREAIELLESGGGLTASSTLELEKNFDQLLKDKDSLERAGRAARAYVENKTGATRRILDYIQEKRLLTN
jgi:3-deoxy-D-manno-octulosonic-acid transferase